MKPSLLSQRPRSLAVAAASLVVAIAAGFALSAATAAPASAGEPCSKQVIDDWFDDGTIDHTYAKHCYIEAIQHLPRDVHTYSNAADDIRAAMLAAFKKGGGTPPAPPPQTSNNDPSGSNATPTATAAAPNAQEPKQDGLILRAIEWLGPSDAGAVPLPLLILAGVAFLLLAAAGGSILNRRLHERRLPPPPQA
jgi:hypothetical protein